MAIVQTLETLTRDEGDRKLGAVTLDMKAEHVLSGRWLGITFSRPFIDHYYVVLLTAESLAPCALRLLERHNFGFKVEVTVSAPGPITVHWQVDAAIPHGPGEVQCGPF